MVNNIIESNNQLLQLMTQLITEKHYDGIEILLQEKRNTIAIKENAVDFIELCKKHMTDENFKDDPNLYTTCECLLKSIAEYGTLTEVLFELLEIIDSAKSDNIFTSALKGLQVLLLRPDSDRKSLEWGLNEVLSFITEQEIPQFLTKSYDEKQRALYEQNEMIHKILLNYITINLFYEPILTTQCKILKKSIYKNTSWSKTNVLASFLLQLLGRPLALLDLSIKEKHKTNTHSLQCARQITFDLCKIFKDPYYLLHYIESRCRFKQKNSNGNIYQPIHGNIFMNEEKFPITSLAIYFYMLISEDLMPSNAPLIYNPLYIFETCLYLVVHLMNDDEPSLHYKGLSLCHKTLNNLEYLRISSTFLDLKINAKFCEQLSKIVIYSDQEEIRKLGIELFKKFILKFDIDGQSIILKKLLEITTHSGLKGYFMTIFKSILSELLNKNDSIESFCSQKEFKYILLYLCCKLENGVETDLIQNSDQIITSLNILRYFTQRDKENITGLWDFIDEIKTSFLNPLREGINLSRAHFKAEEFRIQNDIVMEGEMDFLEKFLINNEKLPNLDKKEKIDILSRSIITFDLLESLLARVNECIENKKL